MTLPTAERVRELFDYDPATGIFIRKIRTANKHQVGDRADQPIPKKPFGYRLISMGRTKYMAHRIAWLYAYGEWPTQFIDHINGDKGDNRLCNLREADNKLNSENITKPYKSSTSGFLGVTRHQGKWYARINSGGRGTWVGHAETPEEAHELYVEAKRKLHKGCTI